MCGIYGITEENPKIIREIINKCSHRGPNGSGIYSSEKVTLGHNLLSITSKPDDGKYFGSISSPCHECAYDDVRVDALRNAASWLGDERIWRPDSGSRDRTACVRFIVDRLYATTTQGTLS